MQKTLLEQKRNRLSGLIELISDVMKGVDTMSFEVRKAHDSAYGDGSAATPRAFLVYRADFGD